MTILYTHKAFAKHDLGRMHPEKPARLEALREAFSSKRFDCVERRESPAATIEQVMRMHPMRYVESIFNAEPTNGLVQLDGDTAICPGSVEAILRAAGRRAGRKPDRLDIASSAVWDLCRPGPGPGPGRRAPGRAGGR